ncbi:MAG: hypothetical protein II252_05900 [Clostridia bacterium]|nr:hypothetical protein [Clostridia bacterium]
MKKSTDKIFIRVSTSGFYRLFVNGKFVHYGPVRCAKKFYRVDEINLNRYFDRDVNHIAIEVVNYRIQNYASINQAGFIQAEIKDGDKIIAFTNEQDGNFDMYLLKSRIRKMQVYSFQRTVTEGYRLSDGYDNWHIGGETDSVISVKKQEVGERNYLTRDLPINKFTGIFPQRRLKYGKFKIDNDKPGNDALFFTGRDGDTNERGFAVEELEIRLSDDIVKTEYYDVKKSDEKYDGTIKLTSGDFELLSLPSERTGFISMNIECVEKTVLYITFDEILNDNEMIDPFRLTCINAIYLELKPGKYSFMNMEPIGFKYINFANTAGKVIIKDFSLIEYVHPFDRLVVFNSEDEQENMIFEAAWQTFRQNTSDIFMDCPTRERAGWLCDSFFTGRTEQFFTGKTLMEKQFLENFIISEPDEHLPCGILDMCYPSDHYNGNYIVSWAMWYVVELNDYINRSGDIEIKQAAQEIVYKLLDFLGKHENSDGLLEKLPGWFFVEWSDANRFIQDINYPTNMLYSYILRIIGKLYDDKNLIIKGEELKNTIIKRSYNGEFFVDNDIYRNGAAVSTGETSETCQYHAFFFDIATTQSHPELWEKLINDFGPNRNVNELYPKVYPSNAFTGNYLRLDILLRYGMYDKCREEIIGYFYKMAARTGTLWENMSPTASCNHGFASYTAFLLYNATLKNTPEFMKM